MALVSAGAPKGKTSAAPKKIAPTPSSEAVLPPAAQQSENSSATNSTGMVLLDLKAVATRLFRFFENRQYEAVSRLFAPGMAYVTNGLTYELDLSNSADVKSIPPRNRTKLQWTYVDGDDYALWGHCIVTYPTGASQPEFLIIHFNRNGLIDLFSHIEPKAAQCTAVVKDVVKLALMRPDGTIVDAPQDQLQRMMEEQLDEEKAIANGTLSANAARWSHTNGTMSANGTRWSNGNGTMSNSSMMWTNMTKPMPPNSNSSFTSGSSSSNTTTTTTKTTSVTKQ